MGWQAPACHSELELASEGSSPASWSLDIRSIGMLRYVVELSYSSEKRGARCLPPGYRSLGMLR